MPKVSYATLIAAAALDRFACMSQKCVFLFNNTVKNKNIFLSLVHGIPKKSHMIMSLLTMSEKCNHISCCILRN